MCKRIFISLLIIFISISMCNVSISMNNSDDDKKNYTKNNEIEIFINNINNKDLNFKLTDITTFEDEIDIGVKYNYYAILTINVENNSIYDFELSNIDIYPYQGTKSTKYFVKTSEDNIQGFIGTVRSKESLDVKIGVALYNKEDDIKLDLINVQNINK